MSSLRIFCSLLALHVLLAASSTSASILTFEPTTGNNLASSTTPLGDTTYGDNIASTGPVGVYLYGMGNGFTPDVTVDYAAIHSTNPAATGIYYRAGGGTVSSTDVAILLTANADNSVAANRRFYITFTPDDPWVGIRLNSFSLHDQVGFPTTTPAGHTVNWTAYAGSVAPVNSLASGTAVFGDGVPLTVNTGLGFTRNTIILELQHAVGARQELYIDNVNFDQLVPEPASVALLLIGGAAIAAGRSRKR